MVYVKCLKWNISKGVYLMGSCNQEVTFEIGQNNTGNFKSIGKAIAPVFKNVF